MGAREHTMLEVVSRLRSANSPALVELQELAYAVGQQLITLMELSKLASALHAASKLALRASVDDRLARLALLERKSNQVSDSATQVARACQELQRGIEGWGLVWDTEPQNEL